MTNIWEFLLFTLTVSAAAGMLLVLKHLLADKLSPRWQYGIWVLLALRILLPVEVNNRYVMLPLPRWIEELRFAAEQTLASAFSAPYEPISRTWFIPLISGKPASITDWLFVIYVAGIIIMLLGYAVSYIRLYILLKKGTEGSRETSDMINAVCQRYSLRSCRAVQLPGISSAFICGIFRPVLVIPEGTVTDEKVILHELLHLKNHDALQSVLWSLLRALHWCNPFMLYVFNRIGNDMEALCDQRVLELLEGEERRDYGNILLSMANDRYARAFGTTSLSNGGKNIARRIQCIARFKKYPKGMALVSVCIGIILLQPIFIGTAAYGVQYSGNTRQGNDYSMLASDLAAARLNRCTTMAGAIDTYAKGIIFEDGLYIATASPLSKQEEIAAALKASRDDGWVYYHMENGLLGEPASSYSEFAAFASSNGFYSVFNLQPSPDDDEKYTCKLAIYLEYYRHTEEEIAAGMPVYYEDKQTGGWLPAMAVYDITLATESKNWVVADCSEPEIIIAETINGASRHDTFNAVGPVTTYTGQGKHGTVTAPVFAEYVIEATTSDSSVNIFWEGQPALSKTAVTNAQFEKADITFDVKYTLEDPDADLTAIKYVTIESALFDSEAGIPEDADASLDDRNQAPTGVTASGSSTSGWSFNAISFDKNYSGASKSAWSGSITDLNCNQSYYYETELSDILRPGSAELPVLPIPEILVSRVYIDGYDTEFIISAKEENHESN